MFPYGYYSIKLGKYLTFQYNGNYNKNIKQKEKYMKKFNKILALGLVSASALTGGLMLSGCDITDDKDKTQTEQSQDEQKVVTSISINTNTLPSYIIRGKFNRANIKATVTYEDNTTKVIDVIESMLDEVSKEEVKYVGQYNLTVNYGGKTATMYANVVDERYLLKEVVEANLDKDVTLTAGNNSCQIDMDNKIIKYNDISDGWVGYTWLSNNITYEYESYEDEICRKSLGSEWRKEAYLNYTADILDILETGKDSDGDEWTIESVEKIDVNYQLTVKCEAEDATYTRVYTFNDDFLCSVYLYYDDGEIVYNYNYSPITLEVPTKIKALEDSATISVYNRIDDLGCIIEGYLKNDFEVVMNGEVLRQYDADKKIMISTEDGTRWFWVNGDDCYKAIVGGQNATKYSADDWNILIKESCFIADVFNNGPNEYSVAINSDEQYYELTVTTNDEEDAVYKYTFNDNEILKIDVSYDGEDAGTAVYRKVNVNLTVPDEIRDMEAGAQQG